VQVVYSAHPTCRGVEEFGGNGFGKRVALAAVHLEAAHEVVAVLSYHAVQFGYLVGRVLKVGIHGDDHITLGLGKATIQGWTLAAVAPEFYASYHIGVFALESFYDFP